MPFLEGILVPRDVVFTDYAAWGGARVSLTTPIYILGANFAEQMLHDEDWMPINDNPHPMLDVPFPDLPCSSCRPIHPWVGMMCPHLRRLQMSRMMLEGIIGDQQLECGRGTTSSARTGARSRINGY